MWAAVAILVCVAVLLWTYMAIAAQKHERAEKERLRKDLDDAEARLRKALEDCPGDFTLHSVLGDVVRGLREQLKD